MWSFSKFFLVLLLQGHRLKNLESQTYLALDKLKTTKRILLSGATSHLPVTSLALIFVGCISSAAFLKCIPSIKIEHTSNNIRPNSWVTQYYIVCMWTNWNSHVHGMCRYLQEWSFCIESKLSRVSEAQKCPGEHILNPSQSNHVVEQVWCHFTIFGQENAKIWDGNTL